MGDAAKVFDLRGEPEKVARALQRGLDMGGALTALACTIPGDFVFVTRGEVEELLTTEDQEIQR